MCVEGGCGGVFLSGHQAEEPLSGLGSGVKVYGAEHKFRVPEKVGIPEPLLPSITRTESNTLSKAGRVYSGLY